MVFCFSSEYQIVIHQSGHSLHHHSAGRQTYRQPHNQQSYGEDRRPQTHQNGAHHQPLLQQQDRTGHCGAKKQVSLVHLFIYIQSAV